MKNIFSIENGNLYTDCDCQFDKDNNKIDVYTSVYWSADTKESYEEKENLIAKWNFENDLVTAFAWCDTSGFEYWVEQQEENNYVSIDVVLKKPVGEYSQQETAEISKLIVEWDNYFMNQLEY